MSHIPGHVETSVDSYAIAFKRTLESDSGDLSKVNRTGTLRQLNPGDLDDTTATMPFINTNDLEIMEGDVIGYHEVTIDVGGNPVKVAVDLVPWAMHQISEAVAMEQLSSPLIEENPPQEVRDVSAYIKEYAVGKDKLVSIIEKLRMENAKKKKKIKEYDRYYDALTKGDNGSQQERLKKLLHGITMILDQSADYGDYTSAKNKNKNLIVKRPSLAVDENGSKKNIKFVQKK